MFPIPTSSPACDSPAAACPDHLILRRHELTSLVLAEKPTFLRVASSILRNPADAEDILHTAFCSAWKALGNFRGESTLKTWFSRIVSNTALMALRKSRPRQTVYLEDNPEYLEAFESSTSFVAGDPEKLAIRNEVLQQIERSLARLPGETRIILAMHFGRDCSIETITRLRKRSRSSVVSHLHRGKALLRKQIARPSPRIVRSRARPN
jgi:RNA polymerase sigma-70 factor, ECF subfamily